MTEKIEILNIEAQPIAAIRFTTNRKRIAEDIGSGFGTLMQWLGKSGQSPTGAPLCIYHDMIDEQTDGEMEVCIPVAAVPEADGSVYGRELEGGSMATTLHRGPYDELRGTYERLTGWILENGYQFAGPPREYYLNDPATVAPAELETRIEFPIFAAARE